ncbi:UTP--glucose-1-phosphate uridylyltransferase [Sulfurimicrobium lacus]|uniref:UTP--glucose-1-phosphate uridylyltransferase n=1 Tax=Sulfurimicrobium lacus TaxID=2715678 RepID=A0A6F8VER1_9PROT|nr:UTP--glucose-1-phosphate uridylyltransferase GalU [Sulfurimicrobium lacus]BCB27432.1 UTP--glucose-1-phosphate uridylyltransferase [Sulfurimicrobium lacus]
MKKITKAVFPVAGFGSRFLPATKASPKEMMPVVDKPLIQYAVEEAVAAGITDMVFITGRNKRTIEDHFDMAYEVEAELAARGKTELLRAVQDVVPKHVNCIYIRQSEPLGLGHAVLCAQPVVQDEAFAVILADDLIDAEPPVIKQMGYVFATHQCSVLGVQEVAREHTGQYGIVSATNLVPGVEKVHGLVEKPRPEEAPSNLAVVGRYILTPRIFHHLAQVHAGAGGEIQLTDGIAALLREEKLLAYHFSGTRYDCGSKLGYLKAQVAFGLKHEDLQEEFSAYLAALQ